MRYLRHKMTSLHLKDKTYFAVNFQLYFDVLFEAQNDFASANLHLQDQNVLPSQSWIYSRWKYVHLKTHLAPQLMHQHLAVILRQLCYAKISQLVVVPGTSESML